MPLDSRNQNKQGNNIEWRFYDVITSNVLAQPGLNKKGVRWTPFL